MARRSKSGKTNKFWKNVGRNITGGTAAMVLARKAIKGFWKLKKLINVEVKNFDVAVTSLSVPSAGTIVQFTGIAEGDEYNQRTGRSIKASSFLLKCDLAINASATSSAFRQLIFIDTMTNGAAPAVTDVLSAASYLAEMNINGVQPHRFRILSDKTFTLSNQGTQSRTFSKYHKLRHHINWYGTGGGTTNMGPGQVFVLWIGSEATNTPTLNYSARFRYVDN